MREGCRRVVGLGWRRGSLVDLLSEVGDGVDVVLSDVLLLTRRRRRPDDLSSSTSTSCDSLGDENLVMLPESKRPRLLLGLQLSSRRPDLCLLLLPGRRRHVADDSLGDLLVWGPSGKVLSSDSMGRRGGLWGGGGEEGVGRQRRGRGLRRGVVSCCLDAREMPSHPN